MRTIFVTFTIFAGVLVGTSISAVAATEAERDAAERRIVAEQTKTNAYRANKAADLQTENAKCTAEREASLRAGNARLDDRHDAANTRLAHMALAPLRMHPSWNNIDIYAAENFGRGPSFIFTLHYKELPPGLDDEVKDDAKQIVKEIVDVLTEEQSCSAFSPTEYFTGVMVSADVTLPDATGKPIIGELGYADWEYEGYGKASPIKFHPPDRH